MSICSAAVRNVRRAAAQLETPVADLPTFLCPGLLNVRPVRVRRFATKHPRHFQQVISSQRRCLATTPNIDVADNLLAYSPARALERLPQQCPGCGAFSQLIDKEEAGFYTPTRKTIKEFLGTNLSRDTSAEDAIFQAALKNAGSIPEGLTFDRPAKSEKPIEPPFCDRCHDIIHHSTGVSIHHPTARAIQDTILESPHKYNHIYHIIDAADFPMSLIPQLQKLLHATPQRSHNRRSKTDKFYRGKKIEMSFIITRSDLLAAKKELVDGMMPYLRTTLRDALGRSAKDVRLGNVRCVSAKRQWWTSNLKEDIFKRGGGGWMVGKVNVGKSQLLHEVFPKGRREVVGKKPEFKDRNISLVNKEEAFSPESTHEVVDTSLTEDGHSKSLTREAIPNTSPEHSEPDATPSTHQHLRNEFIDTGSLLPPLPPEVDYPTMPLVSSLPGTTASPIRLSFGRGKGEMIDLPGLSRGDLELHVKPEHRSSLVMRQRVEPKQQTLQYGRSLLLGGFIRITPTSNVDYLAYNFTPLESHRTSTAKAVEIQAQTEEARNVENIALPEAAAKTKLAGTFFLKWDVTKERTGPITNPAALGIKPEKLPYRVLSTDILIEGVGWVELVAQVRKRQGDIAVTQAKPQSEVEESKPEVQPGKAWFSPMSNKTSQTVAVPSAETKADHQIHQTNWSPLSSPPSQKSDVDSKDLDGEEVDANWPAVEIYTPDGKFVASRRPMNAWLNVASKPRKEGVRPRKSMKGKKKEEKVKRRGW